MQYLAFLPIADGWHVNLITTRIQSFKTNVFLKVHKVQIRLVKGRKRINPLKSYLTLKSICHLHLRSTNFTVFWEKCFLERTELEFVAYWHQFLFNTVAFLSRHLTTEYRSNSTLERWPCNVLNAANPEAPSLCVTVYNLLQW